MSFTTVYIWVRVAEFKSLDRMLLILVILQLTTMTNKKRNIQKILDFCFKKMQVTVRHLAQFINKSLSQFSS